MLVGADRPRQTRAFFEAQLAARLAGPGAPPPHHVPPPAAAPIRYQVMNTVPENWIPFIPVHVPGDSRTIQLQRAALPRILDGDPDPPSKVPATHRAVARGARPVAGADLLLVRRGGATR